MSLRAIIWAFDQIAAGRSPGTSASLTLLKLADRANDDGICWPGRARIGVDVGLSDETVRKCLRQLEEAHLLTVERRKDSAGRDLSNVYHLHLPIANRGEGPNLTTPGVESGGGCRVVGPEPVIRTSKYLSKRERERAVQDPTTGIYYQYGNQDDEKTMERISSRHSQQEIAAAVQQAAAQDSRGRAWPSAVWKILCRSNCRSNEPPAWAMMGQWDDSPAAETAGEYYEGRFEIVEG